MNKRNFGRSKGGRRGTRSAGPRGRTKNRRKRRTSAKRPAPVGGRRM